MWPAAGYGPIVGGYRRRVAERGRPLYSIGAVARMLELPPATIRTWEARYRLVVPERSAGGQRLYSRDHIEQLRFVRDEVSGGRRPGEAHRLLSDRRALGKPPGGPGSRVLLCESRHGAVDVLRQMLGAETFEVTLASDADRAKELVDELAPTVAVLDTDDVAFDELAARLRGAGVSVLAFSSLLRPLELVGGPSAHLV